MNRFEWLNVNKSRLHNSWYIKRRLISNLLKNTLIYILLFNSIISEEAREVCILPTHKYLQLLYLQLVSPQLINLTVFMSYDLHIFRLKK